MGRLVTTSLLTIAMLVGSGPAGAEPVEAPAEVEESQRLARLLATQAEEAAEAGEERDLISPIEDAVKEAAPSAVFDRTEPPIGRWILSVPVISF